MPSRERTLGSVPRRGQSDFFVQRFCGWYGRFLALSTAECLRKARPTAGVSVRRRALLQSRVAAAVLLTECLRTADVAPREPGRGHIPNRVLCSAVASCRLRPSVDFPLS